VVRADFSERILELAQCEDLPVVGEHPLDSDASTFVCGGKPAKKVHGAGSVLAVQSIACQLASSTPTKTMSWPGERDRRLRSPWMRWPTPWKRASFLISM